ncbi:hypothetical protein SISSUDRAFT_1042504 [Sistotremastrum suecicum HHB10207 ss-3]|uniref:Afadin and alpha-actinin-binding-domain-containing protein n=1 Tax=Sistotremastrum suecicum HHB10207 ss-3 TaxID=1314776 RepID=A0A166GI31_9AGAM|nr:hypothetical protein SISSUDRAFT_1042504 [Sistotremastrum suecicum HHB10207 ss-3]
MSSEDSLYTDDTDLEPSSTLQHLNIQLVAHGFAPSPGLCLDGLGRNDFIRVVKALLGLLGQRAEDMARKEKTETKLRTLSYDHDRLQGMYTRSMDVAANAEREMNLYKSRMNGAQKALQECEKKFLHSNAELSKSRSALHSVRAAYGIEVKRKEKEVERIMERWQKMSGGSMRVSGSGSTGVEPAVKTHDEDALSLEEVALQDAENDRNRLLEERERMQDVIVWLARELNSLVANGREIDTQQCLASPDTTLSALLLTLRTRLLAKKPDDAEYTRLNNIIDSLREELTSREVLLKKFEEHFAETRPKKENSAQNLEAQIAQLESEQLELAQERRQLQTATFELDEMRAAIEADRLTLEEEKKEWESRVKTKSRSPSPVPITLSQFLPPAPVDDPPASLPAPAPERKAEPHRLPPNRRSRIGPSVASSSTSTRPTKPKSKPREFVVGKTSPKKSPKKRRAVVSAVSRPILAEDNPLGPSISDSEAPLPSKPTFSVVEVPPLPPMPSSGSSGLSFDSPRLMMPFGSRNPKHAYSPAKPSPLKNMVSLTISTSSSISSPDIPETVVEEAENGTHDVESSSDAEGKVMARRMSTFPPMPASLAAELGIVPSSSTASPPPPIVEFSTDLRLSQVGIGELRAQTTNILTSTSAQSVLFSEQTLTSKVTATEALSPESESTTSSIVPPTVTVREKDKERAKAREVLRKEKENIRHGPRASVAVGPAAVKVGVTGGGPKRVLAGGGKADAWR